MGNCSLEYCPQTGAVLNLGPEFYQIIFSSMKIVFMQSYDKYMKTFERLEGEGALIYYSWMDIPFGESKGLNVKFLFNSIFFTFNFPLSL